MIVLIYRLFDNQGNKSHPIKTRVFFFDGINDSGFVTTDLERASFAAFEDVIAALAGGQDLSSLVSNMECCFSYKEYPGVVLNYHPQQLILDP